MKRITCFTESLGGGGAEHQIVILAKFIGYTDEFYQRLKKRHDTGTGRMSAKNRQNILLSMSEDLFETKPYIKIPDTCSPKISGDREASTVTRR